VKKYIEKPNVYTPRVVEAVQFDNSVESRKAIGESNFGVMNAEAFGTQYEAL
jgi:hypothetical protein